MAAVVPASPGRCHGTGAVSPILLVDRATLPGADHTAPSNNGKPPPAFGAGGALEWVVSI